MAIMIDSLSAQDEVKNWSSYMSDGMNMWIDKMKVENVFRTCVSCRHFQNQPVFCKRFNIPPPGTIIIHGCDEGYSNIEEIPF